MNAHSSEVPSETTEPRSVSSSPLPRHPLARVFGCLALTAAAIGLHFVWNVPPDEVRASERDQGAKKASKPASRSRSTVRSNAKHRAALRKYEAKTFADEPVDDSWARRARTTVHQSVAIARKHAFEGALEEPQIVATQVECRTVRCRFELRSAYSHEIDLLVDALRDLRSNRRPLWSAFDVQAAGDDAPLDAETSETEETDGSEHHFVVVTVAMRSANVQPVSIRVPESREEVDASEEDDDAESAGDEDEETGENSPGQALPSAR